MQQYLTYLCTDINETGLSLVIFLGGEQFYVVRFFFCRVYIYRLLQTEQTKTRQAALVRAACQAGSCSCKSCLTRAACSGFTLFAYGNIRYDPKLMDLGPELQCLLRVKEDLS